MVKTRVIAGVCTVAIPLGLVGGACTGSGERGSAGPVAEPASGSSPARLITGVALSPVSGWTLLPEGPNAHAARFVGDSRYAVVSTEVKASHEEALARLREIDAEQNAPSRFVVIRGYSGLERERLARPAVTSVHPNNSLPDQLVVTRAIVSGNVVTRLEATFAADAGDVALENATKLVGAVHLPEAAGPGAAAVEVQRLSAVPRAVYRIGASAAPPHGEVSTHEHGQHDLFAQAGTNQRINGLGGVQSEISMAVSNDGKNVVVANNNTTFMTSNTFGASFQAPSSVSGAPGNFGDPSLAFGNSGNFYFAFIAIPSNGCGTGIARSKDGGQTFPFLGNAFLSPNTGSTASIPDQEHIAADSANLSSSNQDRVYSVWRDFGIGSNPNCASIGGGFETPSIVCSSDGGSTWTSKATVEAGTDFPRVKVGPDGSVYVVSLQGNNIRLDKFSSCDAGLTQQAGFPVTVATANPVDCSETTLGVPGPGIAGLDRCNDGNDLRSTTVAVDDTNANHVYVAYAAGTATGNEDVFVIDSTNGGKNWRTAQRVNSAVTGHRFMPWVCSTNGKAFVSWYDQRAGAAAGAASNDLAEFFGAAAFLDSSNNLTTGTEFKISKTQDAMCGAGWPGLARDSQNSENCSVQPQLAGQCCAGSTCTSTLCDFSDCAGGGGTGACECAAGQTCNGSGTPPKYGDYNEDACAAGRFYMSWASATPPPGTPPSPPPNANSKAVDVYFACPPNANDVNGTFADTTPPQFTSVPPAQTLTSCGPANIGQATAVDVCGQVVSITPDHTTFGAGTTTVTWTAVDAAGNAATATQQVTVNDQTPPVFTFVPGPVTISTCVGANIGTATATDDCDGAITPTSDAPAHFPLGTTIVTYTATDHAGNSVTATQAVTAVLADDPSCCPVGTNVIVGTNGPDQLNGTDGNDCIIGLGGSDTINGFGGVDFISAGAGDDQVSGGAGNDYILGGDGNDTIDSGPDDDFIDGAAGTDTCSGGTGTNSITDCEVTAYCTAACCATSSCTAPPGASLFCSAVFAQSDCGSYVQGTVVSSGGENWLCSDGNCANCAAFASCAPGATGCPWGTVWTDNGPVAPGCP